MRMILIPGYRAIFSQPTQSYEELLADFPSDVLIALLIMLNNELSAPHPGKENQQRLRGIVGRRFSAQQRDDLNLAFYRFRQESGGAYGQEVFGRRYLIAHRDTERER